MDFYTVNRRGKRVPLTAEKTESEKTRGWVFCGEEGRKEMALAYLVNLPCIAKKKQALLRIILLYVEKGDEAFKEL